MFVVVVFVVATVVLVGVVCVGAVVVVVFSVATIVAGVLAVVRVAAVVVVKIFVIFAAVVVTIVEGIGKYVGPAHGDGFYLYSRLRIIKAIDIKLTILEHRKRKNLVFGFDLLSADTGTWAILGDKFTSTTH